MYSTKNWLTTYILCWLLGPLGLHRFYTGYTGIGIAQFLTAGGFGLWAMIDFLMLSFNKFNDESGYELEGYNGTIAIIGVLVYFFGIVPFAYSRFFH